MKRKVWKFVIDVLVYALSSAAGVFGLQVCNLF